MEHTAAKEKFIERKQALADVRAALVSNGWTPLLLNSKFVLPRCRAMVTGLRCSKPDRVFVKVESKIFEGWIKTNPIVALGTIAHLTEFLVEGFECESDGDEMSDDNETSEEES